MTLHTASEGGIVSVVDALLSAFIHAVDSNGWTACHIAAKEGHVEVLRRLVLAGADVNRATTDKLGHRPLTVAADYGNAAAIDYLVSAGAVVDLTDAKGFTALHCASRYSMGVKAVQCLIRAGANVNLATANDWGDSPITIAAGNGNAAVVKALAEAGADVNFARAGDGASALVMASQNCRVTAVRVLLSLGADPRLACTDGNTALAAAKHHNHPAIAKLLEAKLRELAAAAGASRVSE